MLPPIYSAHRAWHQGIGDCPSEPVAGKGNQFIAADRELWNDRVAKGLGQRLISLSRDESELRWAAFPYLEWYFVASLRGASRQTYFAHARGWLLGEWDDPVQDPAVWLGDLSAFDPPWKDPAERPPDRTRPVKESVREWRELVGQETLTAQFLLAYLYRAVEEGGAVIWRVPAADFRPESPVARLAAFARAALPLDIKKRAAICVNVTSDDALSPAQLVSQGVNLLVLNEAEPVPRAATVLDRRLSLQKGVEPPPAYLVYADVATDGLMLDSDALLLFSVLATERLARCSQAVSPAAMAESTRVVYNLALAGRSRRDSLFDTYILPDSQRRQDLTLDWPRLIADDDCANLLPATIEKLALMEVPTPDSLCLRSRVWDALRKKGVKLDAAVKRWWVPDLAHAQTLLVIVSPANSALCSDNTATALMGTLPAAAVQEVLLDAARSRTFLRLAPPQLPARWCQPVLYGSPRATELFLVVAGSKDPDPWMPWLHELVVRLANLPELPPETPGLILRLRLPYPDARVSVKLAFGELCARFPQTEDMARALAEAISTQPLSPEDTQEILAEFQSDKSKFLTRHLPTAWLLKQAGHSPSSTLLRRLDSRMAGNDCVRETGCLLDFGLWLPWRMATEIPPEALAKCAIGWLRSNRTDRALEEWKQVLVDLTPALSAERVRFLKEIGIPWISGFEMEQLSDLHRRAADLEADLEIHRLRSSAPNEFPETASPWLQGLPADTLRRLNEQSPLELPVARQLLKNPGRARETVMQRYVIAWFGEFSGGRGLPASETEWLWRDSMFRELIARRIRLLYQPAPSRQSAKFWGGINDAISPASTKPDSSDDRSLVAKLREDGYPKIAQYLDPTFHPPRPALPCIQNQPGSSTEADPFHESLAQALAAGRGEGQVWRDLSDKVCRACLGTLHPVQALANHILSLSGDQRRAIDASGWNAYRRAAEIDPRLLDGLREGKNPLPVYSLLAAMKPSWTCGQVALGILLAKGERQGEITAWWLRALVLAVRSDRSYALARVPGDYETLAIANLSRACRRLGLPRSIRAALVADEKYG
jgi:hypothetical protein